MIARGQRFKSKILVTSTVEPPLADERLLGSELQDLHQSCQLMER